jgi:SpoIIAA-like
MIKIESISANALKITLPEKMKSEDIHEIAPQIDVLIRERGQIRLLIDASGFSGWENVATFESHATFIKSHHQKVERIAVIVAHDWQHWLIGAVRIFVHPEVRAFDKSQEGEALQWIVESVPTEVAA